MRGLAAGLAHQASAAGGLLEGGRQQRGRFNMQAEKALLQVYYRYLVHIRGFVLMERGSHAASARAGRRQTVPGYVRGELSSTGSGKKN